MTATDITIRPAKRGDAALIAELVNLAGEGLPFYVWHSMTPPGGDPWTTGRARAARDEGAFSWRNAWIAEEKDQGAGGLVGYVQPDVPEPIAPDLPRMFVPLQELENSAPGTFYVNVLATRPEFQGRGIGSRLLAFAEHQAGPQGMSLIVSDANAGARRLYERAGYRVAARRSMAKDGWENPGTEWFLMVKDADRLRGA
ncbi:hypothetical protein DEA8626_01354 [Defluviimonas aquaemixtae]|uniref:N-acetyltransferase domain-containing protein n=1 Tax=Albidovulum aquaemixtae TaxID=1542388 RepID=A0A2R8B5H2_9RHOB|nr:N-acetyltransferase [Defluviimonas aquaemixtae]SPH17827.1 hypothetical protein DEA8626_01354 [Defluviimonas aquaemixtae]